MIFFTDSLASFGFHKIIIGANSALSQNSVLLLLQVAFKRFGINRRYWSKSTFFATKIATINVMKITANEIVIDQSFSVIEKERQFATFFEQRFNDGKKLMGIG